MADPDDAATVITSRVGALGRIELNKPKAINALSTDMVQAIDAQLREWEDDDSVAAVLVTGRGDRGLCAGGDIKAIHRDLVEGTTDSLTFFADEYAMNHRIAEFPKPYIAIMDGITMGGGVGVSVHGSHRIVTETTKVGMPETGIGLFPDVGGSKILADLPGGMGMYLGLTGLPAGPGDAVVYGLADSFVPREKLDELISALEADASDVDAVISRFATTPPAGALGADEEWISSCFDEDSAEAIVAALRDHESPRANETADVIASKSPTSVAVTFEMIRTARDMSLAEVLERDYRAAVGIGKHPDLQEGIRAQVIDKDRNPQWKPATLAEIDPATVEEILSTDTERKVFHD